MESLEVCGTCYPCTDQANLRKLPDHMHSLDRSLDLRFHPPQAHEKCHRSDVGKVSIVLLRPDITCRTTIHRPCDLLLRTPHTTFSDPHTRTPTITTSNELRDCRSCLGASVVALCRKERSEGGTQALLLKPPDGFSPSRSSRCREVQAGFVSFTEEETSVRTRHPRQRPRPNSSCSPCDSRLEAMLAAAVDFSKVNEFSEVLDVTASENAPWLARGTLTLAVDFSSSLF